MNRFIIPLIIGCLSIISSNSFAQTSQKDKNERIEKLKSQKISFLSEKLQLTPAVAQVFWPLYNEFTQKTDSLWMLQKNKTRALKEQQNHLSNHQKEIAIDQLMGYRWEQAELEKSFHLRLKKTLSINQVINFYEAEHDFKKKLLQQFRSAKKHLTDKPEQK